MPLDKLGKILYPRLQRWERMRKMKMILGVLIAALVFAGLVGMKIYHQGFAHGMMRGQ